MKLQATDIRKKEFKRAVFGGYSSKEVNDFLARLSDQYVQMTADNQTLQSRLQDTQADLERIRQIESALLQALQQAEEQKKEIIEQSKQEARVRVMEGEVAAEALVNTAKQRAENMLHQVKTECDSKMERMKQEFELLDTSYKEVEGHVDQLISEMQVFVDDTNAKIAHLANLKNRKAVAEKLSSAQDLLDVQDARERMIAHKQSKPVQNIEAPKSSKNTGIPDAATEQENSEEERKETPKTSTEKKGPKPRNLHESLAQKQLGHLPDDAIDMSRFFDPIEGKDD